MWRLCSRDSDGIGSVPGPWVETWTMNLLRTHVYSDGGGEEAGAALNEFVNKGSKFKRAPFDKFSAGM